MRGRADLSGCRVTVMGLGLFGGGVGAARYLVRHGARVTVTDLRREATLAPSLAALEGLPIRYRLGGHDPADFDGAEVLVVNPAVPRDSPYIGRALAAGAVLATEIGLFLAECPGPVLAVTGSAGKTTTTTLAGAMLGRERPGTRVGGNIGGSLLDEVDSMDPGDWVVLELSSFQLEALGPLERGVEVAVVTNLSANHLDRHGTLENYAAAKRGLLARLGTRGVAVLNADDPRVAGWAADVPGRSRLFSLGPVSGASGRLQDGALWVDGERLMGEGELAVPGRFNRANALAAALAARAAGVSLEPIREALRAFRGVEHRLELVAERGGVRYVNDSKATTPQATAAALASLEGPVLLLAGGRYKEGVPVAPLVEAARSAGPRLRRVLCFGEAARALEAALAVVEGVQAAVAAGMDGAVETAMAEARPGETVLLSPGCASYDEFTNFEERGRRFKDLVGGVAPRGGGV